MTFNDNKQICSIRLWWHIQIDIYICVCRTHETRWFTNNNSFSRRRIKFCSCERACAYARLTTIIFLLVTFLERMFCHFFDSCRHAHKSEKEREIYIEKLVARMNWENRIRIFVNIEELSSIYETIEGRKPGTYSFYAQEKKERISRVV
jgi:hypothetical protein